MYGSCSSRPGSSPSDGAAEVCASSACSAVYMDWFSAANCSRIRARDLEPSATRSSRDIGSLSAPDLSTSFIALTPIADLAKPSGHGKIGKRSCQRPHIKSDIRGIKYLLNRHKSDAPLLPNRQDPQSRTCPLQQHRSTYRPFRSPPSLPLTFTFQTDTASICHKCNNLYYDLFSFWSQPRDAQFIENFVQNARP